MSLQAHQLACRQGDRLLFENLDFQINKGELLLIEGHNGCGKTTLLKTLATLRHPDDGFVSWQGQPILKLADEFRSELTWLGHHNAIKLDLTAMENLKISCFLNDVVVTDDEVLQALDDMGLYGYEDLPVRSLSQGQKRRTALAYLLLSQSKLWVLDEPFSALDVKA
ncbi:MAG: cytochrome c biogenesis heme-transporting ATPase CcmA, partial [Thiotrichaceae bacterium]